MNKGGLKFLVENTLFGERNKIEIAVKRLQTFEPVNGYQLAFSGGKDSICIYQLALEANVKFTAQYNYTTVDPPELVYFVREHYPLVNMKYPEKNMWELIEYKMFPPTRLIRYCCEYLKEGRNMEGTTITGVRWAESQRRKRTRGVLELDKGKKSRLILNNDNEETRRLYETCLQKQKNIVNPIVD